jgi:hypothetical protein
MGFRSVRSVENGKVLSEHGANNLHGFCTFTSAMFMHRSAANRHVALTRM